MITNPRSRRRTSPDVNITPLIDVVFLLVIFFMVSTTFDRYSEIRIELPDANADKAQVDTEFIDLTIDREGRYYVERREVVNTSVDTLRRALKKALGERTDVPVVISADARTPHQSVISAMEAARRAGLLRVSFATAREAETGS
jgi:biopolymer transport protein ExbD